MAEAAPNTAWCTTNKLKGVQTIIKQTGQAGVGLSKNNKLNKKYDHELSLLSKKQRT